MVGDAPTVLLGALYLEVMLEHWLRVRVIRSTQVSSPLSLLLVRSFSKYSQVPRERDKRAKIEVDH